MLVRGGDVTLTAFRPQSPTCNFGSFPWVPLPRQQQYKPRQTWKERNDNNKTRNSFSFFLFFLERRSSRYYTTDVKRRRVTLKGATEDLDNKHEEIVVFSVLPLSFGFAYWEERGERRRRRKKKQKGEINGEDLQQRHNVNTQRYAVLLAQAKETRLLVFTISSLSLFLCSPHFSSSSSSSFKSLRIRMRFAVLSFLTFSCCRDGRAFKSLSLFL